MAYLEQGNARDAQSQGPALVCEIRGIVRIEQSARRGEPRLPHGVTGDNDAPRPQRSQERSGGSGVLGLGRVSAEEAGGTEVVSANAVTLHVACHGGKPERLELSGDVIQRRASAPENRSVPRRVVFAHETQVAAHRSVGEGAIVINPRLKCVIDAQQTKGSRRGKQFGVGSRRQASVGITLVIGARATVVLEI